MNFVYLQGPCINRAVFPAITVIMSLTSFISYSYNLSFPFYRFNSSSLIELQNTVYGSHDVGSAKRGDEYFYVTTTARNSRSVYDTVARDSVSTAPDEEDERSLVPPFVDNEYITMS